VASADLMLGERCATPNKRHYQAAVGTGSPKFRLMSSVCDRFLYAFTRYGGK
jgi:hypothetical protein